MPDVIQSTEKTGAAEKTGGLNPVAQVEAAGAEDGGGEKSARKHGRSFIYMNLEDAEKAIRLINAHEKRMPKKSFAQGLGHDDVVGRFNQKLAALESYGLVKVQGDNVLLTDLAVEVAYGPTEQARIRAARKGFPHLRAVQGDIRPVPQEPSPQDVVCR